MKGEIKEMKREIEKRTDEIIKQKINFIITVLSNGNNENNFINAKKKYKKKR